jgi:putative Holliday junction resolvase
MSKTITLLSLDVGEKRIGIAQVDTGTKIAFPVGTIEVDGLELERLRQIIAEVEPSKLVVGFPRNQSGEATEQSRAVQKFAQSLRIFHTPVVYQDESLTSVVAEERLKRHGKPYEKADIDSEAARIILQDYVEEHYGH